MSWTDTFMENLGLKSLSLFLAVLLWLSVTMKQEGEATLTVPVVLQNIPSHLAVDGKTPATIEVEISGPRIDLIVPGKERLTAALDLKGAGEGPVAFTNMERTVHLRSGLRVVRVQPSTIEIKLVNKERMAPANPGR